MRLGWHVSSFASPGGPGAIVAEILGEKVIPVVEER